MAWAYDALARTTLLAVFGHVDQGGMTPMYRARQQDLPGTQARPTGRSFFLPQRTQRTRRTATANTFPKALAVEVPSASSASSAVKKKTTVNLDARSRVGMRKATCRPCA